MENEIKSSWPSFPIGTEITYEGEKYRVCASILNRCRTCVFSNQGAGGCKLPNEARVIFGRCGAALRTDRQKVIFRKVK